MGGISEPTLFGTILLERATIIFMMIGGFVGGLYAGIMNVLVHFVGAGNITVCLGFAGEKASSLPQGIIACVISFVVTLALCFVFGVDGKKRSLGKKAEVSA